MKLIKNEIENIDLSYYGSQLDGEYFSYLKDPKEHYKLLTYITKLYNDILILDAGTASGHSCIALAQNRTNKVYTYDIYDKNILYITDNYFNVTKKILDINLENNNILESAKIIMLDIDPHNGYAEEKFYNKLLLTNFNGILICDDINLNDGMKRFWSLISKEKYDITELGHWSGTGLVNFSDEKIEIL